MLFQVADANQDGQLSPAELNQAVGEAARTAIQVAFQTADIGPQRAHRAWPSSTRR